MRTATWGLAGAKGTARETNFQSAESKPGISRVILSCEMNYVEAA